MECPHCHKIFSYKEQKMRSLPQNKYYFKVIVEILSDHLGYTKDQIHELLKEEFLYEILHIKTKDGIKEKKIVRSTTELTTAEAEKFYSDIRQWASLELNCYIPEPNEILTEN